ncbi:hypothetical protein [Listeria booriae]|uniref:Uncharacterized protein n=1 Tax=Listeria booriae TaxID=1552123 RepID=A0A7X0Z9C6_9LIST|nr:hypothetical protein [Listeria booriae]MBC1914176.1 hypothetical protein [Listeria booriae]MBC2178192.1 hypothetical protein [Listeria booriae]MBC2178281.1 hypothetical protein [Listeria booriae]MBC2676248.1 hypothetical protein [Listeria booriae]
MSEKNEELNVGDEARLTDIVTIIDIDEDNVKVRTNSGYELWTTKDNLDL